MGVLHISRSVLHDDVLALLWLPSQEKKLCYSSRIIDPVKGEEVGQSLRDWDILKGGRRGEQGRDDANDESDCCATWF